MFRELGKLKDAERLLRERKFGEVLLLVRDPEIREHKRAHDAAEAAREGLLEEARADLGAGRIPAAGQKVRLALNHGAGAKAAELEREIREAATRSESEAKAAQRALREARWHEDHGDRAGARKLLAPFRNPEVASFVRKIDETEQAETKARDAVLEAIAKGESPEGLRSLLRDLRRAARDRGLLADAHARGLAAAVRRRDAAELAGLVGDVRSAGIDAGPALDEAAAALVRAASASLDRGCEVRAAAEWLAVFPAGTPSDDAGLRLKLGCWALGRARALSARGCTDLAREMLAEARAALPASACADVEGLVGEDRVGEAVARVAASARGGDHEQARRALDEALRRDPEASLLQDWAAALDATAAERDALLAEARAALASGDARRARRCALRLGIRGAVPPDAAALAGEIDALDRAAQRRALEAERQLLKRGVAAPRDAARPEPMPDFLTPPSIVLPGDPFILRVENEGDWLVHPGARLTIGNQVNGEADLQVLAAIGARHATIERTEDGDGRTRYRIAAGTGQRVTRNGRPVTEADLENGDRIQLGHALAFTFHRPKPENATAAIRLHGDFALHGCTRLVLFSETGRRGSILLAPGSDGHAPLRSVDARLEIFRADEGDEAGELFARSPLGVAAGDEPERAQVRVRGGRVLGVGALRVYVDSVGKRAGPGPVE
jgi:tetratricopeptide (TPR) repeat protein